MPTLTSSARARPPDEKLTVNLGVIDLGRIDLLVAEGFYANRTDLIRGVVRAELERQASTVEELVARRMLLCGICRFGAVDLQAARDAGERLEIRVLGLAVFADDMTPELVSESISAFTVLGALQTPPLVRKALARLPTISD